MKLVHLVGFITKKVLEYGYSWTLYDATHWEEDEYLLSEIGKIAEKHKVLSAAFNIPRNKAPFLKRDLKVIKTHLGSHRDPKCVFNFLSFFERTLYKSNYIIFIWSWCGTHTKIRSKLVDIVTAESQKITLWGPQRTPLGMLFANFCWNK